MFKWVVFLWLRWVYTQFGNIQGRMIWSRRIGGIQSTVSEVNGALLKRALFWTGWASIVNTSFSCLTPLPSNRKTEMRPCAKKQKKKKTPKGLQTILAPPCCRSPCTARRPAEVKITSDVSAYPLDITKPVQTDASVLCGMSGQSGPGTQTPDKPNKVAERWLVSFVIFVQASDTVTCVGANGWEWF